MHYIVATAVFVVADAVCSVGIPACAADACELMPSKRR